MSSFVNTAAPMMSQSDYMMDDRLSRIQNMCMMVIDGVPVPKYDFIANIKINGMPYFSVYRRYNNIYEFVVEDYRGDFHVFMNQPIRTIVANLLCLTNQEHNDMSVSNATSFGHNAPIHGDDVINMPLSVVQTRYVGVTVNLYNILWNYQEACDYCNNILNQQPMPQSELDMTPPMEMPPTTPVVSANPEVVPDAPKKNLSDTFNEILSKKYDDIHFGPSVVRLSVFIPEFDDDNDAAVKSKSDNKDMSMRHNDIKKRRAEAVAKAIAGKKVAAETGKNVAKKRRRDVSPENDVIEKKEYNLRKNKIRNHNK